MRCHIQTPIRLRQRGAHDFVCGLVFGLYERKNQAKKVEKYRSAEGSIAGCVSCIMEVTSRWLSVGAFASHGEPMNTPDDNTTPSQKITNRIAELADWRGAMVARLRGLILSADPTMAEEWKWDSPVWSHHGNVVSAGVFKDHVKLNFFKGAALEDPHGLFNAGLDAKATRAIDIRAGDTINEPALQELIRAAVALNSGKPKPAKQ
jgi:hypothetical protein